MSRAVAEKPNSPLERTIVRVSHGERVVLRQGRKAVAAVVSLDDLKRLQQLEDQEDIRDARSSRKEAKKKGTIPWEKVKTELGLK
jgi:antitoxin (DNA-binding transcriptional repressor) of toxin-antitoxin stability system